MTAGYKPDYWDAVRTGEREEDAWQRPDNTCPRCKKAAANLFRTKLPGDELDTTHCGCLYGNDGALGIPSNSSEGKSDA
jgi:hypothetical protein